MEPKKSDTLKQRVSGGYQSLRGERWEDVGQKGTELQSYRMNESRDLMHNMMNMDDNILLSTGNLLREQILDAVITENDYYVSRSVLISLSSLMARQRVLRLDSKVTLIIG